MLIQTHICWPWKRKVSLLFPMHNPSLQKPNIWGSAEGLSCRLWEHRTTGELHSHIPTAQQRSSNYTLMTQFLMFDVRSFSSSLQAAWHARCFLLALCLWRRAGLFIIGRRYPKRLKCHPQSQDQPRLQVSLQPRLWLGRDARVSGLLEVSAVCEARELLVCLS